MPAERSSERIEKYFFDTTILIYAVSQNDPRAPIAEELLTAGGTVSVQVLNEFVSVARRKIGMNWNEVNEALNVFRALCHPPLAIASGTHESALRIAERYGFHIYDALIVVSALEANCTTLYSEDLQHGQKIDFITITNPFKKKP